MEADMKAWMHDRKQIVCNPDNGRGCNWWSIALFSGPKMYDIQKRKHSGLAQVIKEFADTFGIKPGMTTVECHYIPTSWCSVKVPPRRVSAHDREEFQRQFKDVLDQGIIEEGSSPWVSPMAL